MKRFIWLVEFDDVITQLFLSDGIPGEKINFKPNRKKIKRSSRSKDILFNPFMHNVVKWRKESGSLIGRENLGGKTQESGCLRI